MLHPYFTGLPILMINLEIHYLLIDNEFQSLFYWITYSYMDMDYDDMTGYAYSFNPYFTGLPILMI